MKFIKHQGLEDQIQKALYDKIEKKLRSQIPLIKKRIEECTKDVFTVNKNEEYLSLTSGKLMAEFGLSKNTAKETVDIIIDAFSKQIEIEFNNGGMDIYSVSADFQEILALDAASYTSVNRKGDSTHIPWLKWYLLEGDRILVEGFSISLKDYSKNKWSRSKGALMIKNPAGSWKKPQNPKFSGVINDNWITHVIADYIDFYQIRVKEAIKEALNV